MEKLNNNETILKLSITDSIDVKPDKAVVVINIDNEKDNELFIDNKKALDVGARTIDKALRIIKSFNIKDENIETSRLNINAKYEYTENIKQTGSIFSKEMERKTKSVIAGYNFRSTIKVKLDSNDERVVKLYCELVSNKYMRDIKVEFITENTDEYYNKLLEKIIDKARNQAFVIAKAAFKTVDTISNISIGSRMYNISYNSFANSYCDDADCDFSSSFEESVSNHINSMAETTKQISETIEFEYKLK